jgi:hypothetical protein
MATMFARSALTTWNNTGSSGSGWSNTSGGASNGVSPNSSTDVVFDSNSGTARNIAFTDGLAVGFIPCKSITTNGAAALTFNNTTIPLQITAGNIDFTGSNATCNIQYTSTGTSTVNGGNSTFTSFSNTDGSSAVAVVLSNNLSVSGQLLINFLGGAGSFNANNFNATIDNLSTINSPTLTMGSGTWTITAVSGTPWAIAAGTVIVPGTSTIKFTGSGSGSKTFNGQGKTYANFWNATTGSGACIIGGGATFSNFKIDAGRVQQFQNGTASVVASVTADGTGGQITLSSDSAGNNAQITKSGGGTIYVDRCTIQDIHALPSSTWYARNSTDVSGNTGITFIPGNSNFASFF